MIQGQRHQNKFEFAYETTNPTSNAIPYDSTLINRNDSSIDESKKNSLSLLKKTKSEEKFTLVDISAKNIDISKIFSKISPKRYKPAYKKKFNSPKRKFVLQPNSLSMPSFRDGIMSSKSIQSVKSFKSSKKSVDENRQNLRSLNFMPSIKKQTVQDILDKWQNQDVKPFKHSINPFEVMK